MATWLSRPPAMSSKRRRSSAVMPMNAGSREPQSSSIARRVSGRVVNGPGVNSSEGCAMAAFLLGGTDVGTPAVEPPQAPAGEQHHDGDAETCPAQEIRAPAQPDDRRQQIEHVVEVETERARIGLAPRTIQLLQLLRPVAGKENPGTGP